MWHIPGKSRRLADVLSIFGLICDNLAPHTALNWTDLLQSGCLHVTFVKGGFEAIQDVSVVAVHHACVDAKGQAGEVHL